MTSPHDLYNQPPERYFRMPPVGMTETRVSVGEVKLHQFTVRCGSINCWFVGHGGTPQDAQIVLNDHTCPTPPARNELPTGRSTLEKMWDEMDDVTTAIIDKSVYNAMEGDKLRGYAQGIAFALSMMTHPYFHTIKDISREAGARYKMRKGVLPYRKTPSYNYNPMPEQLTANIVGTRPATKQGAPAKKAATVKKSAPPKVTLPPEKISAIKAGHGAGMFSKQELAEMYGVTLAQVTEIVG